MKKYNHFLIYNFQIFILLIIGIISSIYLTTTHYKNYTDISYSSFCAISRTFNCDTVAQSEFSIFIKVPIATWGIVAYLLYLTYFIQSLFATNAKLIQINFLILLGLTYSVISVMLATISTIIIKSYCIVCIITYCINFLLFLHPLIIRNRIILFEKNNFSTEKNLKLLITPAIFILLSIALIIFYPKYWNDANYDLTITAPTGFTEDKSPWIGSINPILTIEEFTDYQCYQCKKLHYFTRKLINAYPNKIKLIHHHFPLDHNYNPLLQSKPFHIGSGELSIVSIYAASKGQFWEINDELYRTIQPKNTQKINLTKILEKFSLHNTNTNLQLSSREIIEKLQKDIQYGFKNGVTSTPSFLIDGKLYQGHIPSDILKRLKNEP